MSYRFSPKRLTELRREYYYALIHDNWFIENYGMVLRTTALLQRMYPEKVDTITMRIRKLSFLSQARKSTEHFAVREVIISLYNCVEVLVNLSEWSIVIATKKLLTLYT